MRLSSKFDFLNLELHKMVNVGLQVMHDLITYFWTLVSWILDNQIEWAAPLKIEKPFSFHGERSQLHRHMFLDIFCSIFPWMCASCLFFMPDVLTIFALIPYQLSRKHFRDPKTLNKLQLRIKYYMRLFRKYIGWLMVILNSCSFLHSKLNGTEHKFLKCSIAACHLSSTVAAV